MKNVVSGIPRIKLSYVTPKGNRPQFKTSSDVYHVVKHLYDRSTIELREEFNVLYVNRNNRLLGVLPLSIGDVKGSIVDVRIVIVTALLSNASSIILVHNHPSGNTSPSTEDKEITSRISHAAKFHSLKVIEHMIVTKDGYLSFSDEGLLE